MDKIPEMKIEGGKVVEETMSLDIVVNDETQQVVLRKLSSGVRGKIRSLWTKTRYLAGQPSVDINDAEFEIQLLHAAIVSAPFPHDLEGIRNLPSEVADYLMSSWADFSMPSETKKD